MIKAKRSNCLLPSLQGRPPPSTTIECLTTSEIQAMLQAYGYSDNPTSKFETLRRIEDIKHDDSWADEGIT